MCNPSSWSDLTFCNDFLLPPFTLFLLHHHHHASFRGGLSFQCSLLVEGSSIPRQDETTHPRNYPISGEKTPRYPAGCWYMGRCSPRFPITGGGRGWPNSFVWHLRRPSFRARDELSSCFGSNVRELRLELAISTNSRWLKLAIGKFFSRPNLLEFFLLGSSQTRSDCRSSK